MDATQDGDGPAAMVERLRRATNQRDLEALVACFAPDYRNETPVHPERGFTGRAQVRKNWEQIFAAVPDITSTVLSWAVDGDTERGNEAVPAPRPVPSHRRTTRRRSNARC